MSDERLGASFGIDITELKTGLKQANKLIRESESEFKSAAAGMDNWAGSEEGLNAKIKSLTNITQVQREKVRALKEEYNRLIDEGMDPTSQQAVELRTKINNEEAALKSNEKELQSQKEALENLGDETEKSGEKFEKFGNVAKKVGQIAAVALAAAAAAVGALGKAALDSYADYEQLVGGVDTLFKDSSQKVQNYAANAYKTAGLSANDYMEQATSFSASLIQSLGGDTAKAAEYANKAIVDMSDNANKMGTDIESIQNAYGGFAKQNFTMLDNLKLGYGGTKEEMERLLEDATKLSGVEYDISSYADIVDAIHVVQDNLGITGTTAKEASETISGSINAMKGAWSNLLTGLADDNADIDKLINNLVDSVLTVLDNILPRIKTIISGIIKMVEQLVPKIPAIIKDLLPEVISGAVALVDGIVKVIPQLVQIIVDVIPQIIQALLNMIPSLITAAVQIITSIVDGISAMLPQIIDAVVAIIPKIIQALVAAIPQLLQAAIQLLLAIVKAIPTIVMQLQAMLPQIIDAIVQVLINSMPILLDGAIQLFMAILEALPVITGALISALPELIVSIVTSLVSSTPQILSAAFKMLMGIVKAIPKIAIQLVASVPQLITTIVNGLAQGISKVTNVGTNLVKGLWNGIKNAKDWILGKIKGFGEAVLDGLKSFFGIHSPSKLIEDEVGIYVGEAVGTGAMKSLGSVLKNVKTFGAKVTEGLSDSVSANIQGFNGSINGTTNGSASNVRDSLKDAGKSVVVYQTNNYSQAHSRYELYKSKQQTAAAVRLAMAGGI